MFEKNMKIAYLLDFYAEALDEHTVSVLKAYYNDDLSLAEIAADEGISRQGIRHLVKKGEQELEFFEKKFALAKKQKLLEHSCKAISDICKRLEDNGLVKESAELLTITQNILKGNQDVPESY